MYAQCISVKYSEYKVQETPSHRENSLLASHQETGKSSFPTCDDVFHTTLAAISDPFCSRTAPTQSPITPVGRFPQPTRTRLQPSPKLLLVSNSIYPDPRPLNCHPRRRPDNNRLLKCARRLDPRHYPRQEAYPQLHHPRPRRSLLRRFNPTATLPRSRSRRDRQNTSTHQTTTHAFAIPFLDEFVSRRADTDSK